MSCSCMSRVSQAPGTALAASSWENPRSLGTCPQGQSHANAPEVSRPFRRLMLGSATVAAGGQWFTIATASEAAESAIVEIDLETVHAQGNSGEGVIRVTHDVLQPHPAGFGY